MKRSKNLKKITTFRVGVYLRLSVEDVKHNVESESISNQRKITMTFIEEHEDLIFFQEYIDDGKSGFLFERPGFQEMLEDARKGLINCIIVKDQSRFGREHIETEMYITKTFKELGIRFIAICDNYDTLYSGYDMMFSIRNLFNEHYARDISQKCQAAFKAKQKNGEFIGAFACYGYVKSKSDRHKLEIDQYAAVIVKRIYDMYIAGYGKRRIATILNEEGILCPAEYKKQNGYKYRNSRRLENTKYWTYSTINKILKNEMYTGTMVQGTTCREIHGRPELLDESEWIRVKGTHEAIIDEYTWKKVQILLKKRKTDLDFEQCQSIFAGFLRCGDCGRAMAKTVRKNTKGTPYYTFNCGTYKNVGNKQCSSHYIKEDVIKEIVLSDLNCIISNMKALKKIVENASSEVEKKISISEIYQTDYEKTKTELEKVKQIKKTIFEEYALGNISGDEYAEYREEYVEKEKTLKHKLQSLEEKLSEKEEFSILDLPWVQHLLRHNEIKELTREIIIEMIDVIYIYADKRIKIVYNFSNEYENLF